MGINIDIIEITENKFNGSSRSWKRLDRFKEGTGMSPFYCRNRGWPRRSELFPVKRKYMQRRGELNFAMEDKRLGRWWLEKPSGLHLRVRETVSAVKQACWMGKNPLVYDAILILILFHVSNSCLYRKVMKYLLFFGCYHIRFTIFCFHRLRLSLLVWGGPWLFLILWMARPVSRTVTRKRRSSRRPVV